jgi:hypothetical protein
MEPDDVQQPQASLPEPPRTGDPAVDEALQDLADAVRAAEDPAMSLSLEDQVAVLELAHRALQDRLADVEG